MKNRRFVIYLALLVLVFPGRVGFLHAQARQAAPAGANLDFGINLSGMADWATELPFVDLMHNAREWYTKDSGNPADPWDSGQAAKLTLRPDGYPTHLPQTVAGVRYPQEVATIWAVTDGWPAGSYTVLWDGQGQITMGLSAQNVRQEGPNRLVFSLPAPKGSQVELRIRRSERGNPLRNIRVLMPGHEATYQSQPFNPRWLEKLRLFSSVRFMDWGRTNSWGQAEPWEWENPREAAWDERARMDYYTWSTAKGIPYEMMIRLMNDYDLDGWVCIPHNAGPGYLRSMAELFHRNLEPGRVLTVEYSNEMWNWMFGQTHWLNTYGDQAVPWPERTVPYIQRALDAFTAVFGRDSPRLRRVVALQTGWLDVSQRIVRTMRTGSFDAIAPAWYFGLGEEGDAALDKLGTSARVEDVVREVKRAQATQEMVWLAQVKETIADPLGLPMVFYEGGQHITPTPFGEEPAYARALLDIQRHPAMLQLYRDWLNFMRTLGKPGETLTLMHFSFVGGLSAQYGSWGLLEELDQDLEAVPAPKWQALLEAAGGR